MAMMILSDIKLVLRSDIYLISGLSNRLIDHGCKKINTKLEQIWRLILRISRYNKLRFVWLLMMGRTLVLLVGNKK